MLPCAKKSPDEKSVESSWEKNHEKVRVRKVQEPVFFKGSHQVVKKCKSVLASGDQIPSYQPEVKKETACNRSRNQVPTLSNTDK